MSLPYDSNNNNNKYIVQARTFIYAITSVLDSGTDTALSLNAAELLVGGVINVSVLNTLPSDVSRISLRGCFEAPRFTSSGLTAEPPLLLSFEDQIKSER